MKFYNLFATTLILLFLGSCGNNSEAKKDAFSIEIKNAQKTYTPEDEITISLINKKNLEIDSINYFLNLDRIGISNNIISLSGKKLGEKTLKAEIYSDGETYEAVEKITILSSFKPKLYT